MINVTVITSNIIRCLAMIERLRSRDENVEGMALLYGISGEGKTTAVTYVCNREDAIYLRARATWTPRGLLQSLVEELGLSPTYALNPMIQAAIDKLRLEQKPVFIDEADYLLSSSRPRQIDIVRDLYDETKAPIILVGSEDLARRLKSNAALDKHRRRIWQWIEFSGVSYEDAAKAAEQLSEVDISPDIVEALFASSRGNMAAIVSGIAKIEEFASANSLDKVSQAEWKGKPFPKPSTMGYRGHEALS